MAEGSRSDLSDIKNEVQECIHLSCSDKATTYSHPLRVMTLNEMKIVAPDMTYDASLLSETTPKFDYLDEVLKFINRGEHTDLVVKVAGTTFKCHLILLQWHSEYFNTFKGVSELQIPDGVMTARGFVMLYSWMLRDDARVERNYILELYQAAVYLKVEMLEKQIWLYFDSSEIFNEDTAFQLALEARALNVTMIHDVMMARVTKYFLCIIFTDYFLNLDDTEFIAMMKLSSLAVNSEMEIFMIIVRWLNHDWENRKSFALRALNCLRFDHLPEWFLAGLEAKEQHEFSRRVVNIPEFKEKVIKILHDIKTSRYLPLHFLLAKDNREQKEVDRLWIVDKNCSHHHKRGCANWKHITFQYFNEYLRTIIAAHGATWKHFEYKKSYQYPPCCLAAVEPNP